MISYINGNVFVDILDDGTKIRKYNGEPKPKHPESIDVKITNYCDGGCSYCHEQSTTKGNHADLHKLLKVLNTLPAGVELALGGGNIFSHPDFIYFIGNLKGKICNITVNQKHISNLFDRVFHHGVGISITDSSKLYESFKLILNKHNVVFHLIAGINNVDEIYTLISICSRFSIPAKVLVLGYKDFGFGKKYLTNNPVQENIYQWYTKLPALLGREDLVLSFDNLAIEQLKLKRMFTEEAWERFYMGDDGRFSMYIDGVKQQYARSSTSNNRVGFDEMSLKQFFRSLQA